MIWRKWFRWTLFIVALTGVGIYVSRNIEDFRVVLSVGPRLVLALCMLHIGMLLVLAVAFFSVARRFGLTISFYDWLRIYSASRVLNVFVPHSANAYRVAELKLNHGFSIASYVAILSVFTLLNRVFTAFLAFLTILLTKPDLTVAGVKVAPALGGGCFAICLLVLAGSWLQQRNSGSTNRILCMLRIRPSLLIDIVAATRNPRLLATVFVSTLVGFSLSLYAHLLAFRAIQSDIGLAQIAILRVSRSVLDIVSFTPGNAGVSEALYGTLTSAMDTPASEGIVVSALITAVSTIAVVIVYVVTRFAFRKS